MAAVQYRVLGYPNRGYTVVLFGLTATAPGISARSTCNRNPVHGITDADGGSSSAMLRTVSKAVGCEAH